MMNLHGGVLEVRVCEREEMDQSLNAAVDRMVAAATQHGRQGILVTRLGMGHFKVELTDAVPYGYTEELDKAQQLTLKNPLPGFGNNPPNARSKATGVMITACSASNNRCPAAKDANLLTDENW